MGLSETMMARVSRTFGQLFENVVAISESATSKLFFLLQTNRIFFSSLLITAIYSFPSLIGHSRNVGYLYTGDVLGYYWPFLLKAYELMRHFTFSGLDISHYNGSSEFYLTSNVYPAHPLFVLYSLLQIGGRPSFQGLGHLLAWLVTIHMFIFFYFTAKLLSKIMEIHFGAVLFGAAVAAFGIGTVTQLGEPEYIFSVSSVSWCIYASLTFEKDRNIYLLPIHAIPTIFFITGGYIPIGVATLFLSVAIIVFHISFLRTDMQTVGDRISSLFICAVPILIALIVCSPFLFATYVFLQATPSVGTPSLFYSAHQLSELPQTFLRILSSSYSTPGPFYEFSVQFGLIPLSVIGIFFLTRRASSGFTVRDWMLLKFCAVLYALTVLAIYGTFSPVSDIVFYFVPQVGKMHIYQRLLFPAQLLFGIIMAILLNGLLRADKDIPFGPIAMACFAITLVTAFFVSNYPDVAASFRINNGLIFEFLALTMFMASFTLPGTHFKAIVAIGLFCLPSLGSMYNWTRPAFRADTNMASQPLFLDKNYQQSIAAFMRSHSNKTLIKYEDVTSRWYGPGEETFPKSFPYLMSNLIDLSSYGGFNFYLAVRGDYMARMPVGDGAAARQLPDWDWLAKTGADFIVAPNSYLERLKDAGAISGKPDSYMQLPREVVLAPLTLASAPDTDAAIFDNGYIRVKEGTNSATNAPRVDLALSHPATQSGTLNGASASLAVDGNPNGNMAANSVSHTTRNNDAWWQVDLGSKQTIGKIVIRGRSDCCAERRQGIWVMVSDNPFSETATADQARKDGKVWSRLLLGAGEISTLDSAGLSGRYVRVQLDGTERGENAYLSLAEVEVLGPQSTVSTEQAREDASKVGQVTDFSTNKAGWIRAELNALKPMSVDYLFWANPRLRFSVDGTTVQPRDDFGLKSIPIPVGRHVLEIRVVNLPLTIFWVLYAAFGVSVLVSAIIALARIPIRHGTAYFGGSS